MPVNLILLLCAVIMIACIAGNKLSGRLGIPTPVSYTHLPQLTPIFPDVPISAGSGPTAFI